MVSFDGSCNTENFHFLYEAAGSGFKAVFVHVSVYKCIFSHSPFHLTHLSQLSQVPVAVVLQCALHMSV